MGSPNRWLKLAANWMDSDWLVVLSAEARLAWVQLLCYAGVYGIGGVVKAQSALVFARKNFVGEEAVTQMLTAAKRDGALETSADGDWVIVNWNQYQVDGTAADRKARHRERQKAVEEADPKPSAMDIWSAFPANWKVPALQEAWSLYQEHRRGLRLKQYTASGLSMLWSMVQESGMAPEDFAGIVRQVISSNWQGIPPRLIKEWRPASLQVVKGGKESAQDEVARLEAAMGVAS